LPSSGSSQYHLRMFLRRYGTFAGGIDLPDEKHTTIDEPIASWHESKQLRVPLAACDSKPARPLVRIGQYVAAGERIAAADDARAVDVFSPVAGRVSGFTSVEVADRDAFRRCRAIELADVSLPSEPSSVSPTFDWRAASSHTLRERLCKGTLTTYRRPPHPLTEWLQAARRDGCRVLVANAIEGQPYVTADHRLLVEHGTEVIRGLAILIRAIEAKQGILAVDQRRTDDYRELVGPARMYQINRVALPHKYPIGSDAMLLNVLLRREIPLGGTAGDIGAAVVDPATCFAVYRWVACGIPPTGRVVTVAGERVERPGNYWVSFGTACRELVSETKGPILHGGPMSALSCSPLAVVGPATDAVLAIDTSPPPTPGPCLRCGWCTDHCPARLNVAALNDHFELGTIELARRSGVMACVECGVCSYVCPARLPLSQRVRQLKRAVAKWDNHLTKAGARR